MKKEQKLYLWDWSSVPDQGARFENLVAPRLLKHCHFVEDDEGFRMELRFLRDTDKREVDFIVLKDGKPLFAEECKIGDKNVNPFLSHFMERPDIPAFYQVHTGTSDYEKKGVRVPPLCTFCDELRLP